MQKRRNRKYIIYGFVAIAILFIAYVGFKFLQGSSIMNKTNTYYIYYERIEGLNSSSPVTVNGYQIGQVSNIDLLPDNDCKLLVEIEITNEFLLPDSTLARIYSMDLMGSKGIELVFGKSNTYCQPNDTLIGEVEQSLKDQVSLQMLPVKNQAENLMKEIEKAIAVISYIFNEKTRANLEQSFASIKTTMSYIESSAYSLDTILNSESSKIAKILSNVESITFNLKNNNEKINDIINNISDFSDTLAVLEIAKTINEANQALENFNAVITKVNNGEGSMGKLLNDDKLAIQLENAANSLDRLLNDLRLNPKKYVRFSLIDVGRTVNVNDESELRKKDIKHLEREREKDEKRYNKKLKKEEKRNKKNNKKSKKVDETSNANLYFMIQIRAAKKKIELNSVELKGYSDVVEIKIGDTYKYCIFPHEDDSKTDYYLELAQEDFQDAFPVAFLGGNLIPYSKGVVVANSQ